MGIRYYAYPITSKQYPEAAENPCRFHGADPLMDAWGPVEGQPEMLYLDKCWSELQVLLGPEAGVVDRPAQQLVAGAVTHTPTGWIPHEQALSPGQVREIAADLAMRGGPDIRRVLPQLRRWHESDDVTYEYVSQYLAAAQAFTERLAASGRGLGYMIG